MKPDVILVPIDYSGCAHEVAAAAASLAGRLGAEVVLLHALSLPSGVSGTTPVFPPDAGEDGVPLSVYLGQDAQEHLAPLADIFSEAGCPVRVVVREGDPAKVILATAGEVGASYIAMGTHGRTGLRRLFEGSVAEQVIRRADVPVIVVRTHDEDGHPGLTDAQAQAEAEAIG